MGLQVSVIQGFPAFRRLLSLSVFVAYGFIGVYRIEEFVELVCLQFDFVVGPGSSTSHDKPMKPQFTKGKQPILLLRRNPFFKPRKEGLNNKSRDSFSTDIKPITTLHPLKPYACEGSLSPASRKHFSKILSETLLQEALGFRV